MIKRTNIKTVSRLLGSLLLAVFFSHTLVVAQPALENLETGLNDLIYDLSQSIVTIEAIEPVYPANTVPGANEAVYSIVSTGLIFDTLGHIITSASSVVGRSSIMIKFANVITTASVTAIDYQSGLALLTVDKKFGKPIQVSESHSCAGQMILALGNSFGLRASPSLGFCAGYRPDELLQFSASFPSGTIGGGLFTLSGQMVGMISGSVGQYGSSSIGLAIPAKQIIPITQYLIQNGTRDAGYMGLSTTEIEINPPLDIYGTGELNTMAGTRTETVSTGVVVTRVIPNSPADRSGLQYGDILYKINNINIFSALELVRKVKEMNPGEIIVFDMLRHNRPFKVNVPVGSYARQSDPFVFQSNFENFSTMRINDSLQNEINILKDMLKSFEDRLNRLR